MVSLSGEQAGSGLCFCLVMHLAKPAPQNGTWELLRTLTPRMIRNMKCNAETSCVFDTVKRWKKLLSSFCIMILLLILEHGKGCFSIMQNAGKIFQFCTSVGFPDNSPRMR